MGTLFQVGTVGGLSDGELLERFAIREEGAGEAAFEEVVRRHGPMVLGVCRRVLGDRHAADDAFQATFLVLALKAGSVRKKDSLGPWLHGVAARVARRARQVDRGRKEVAFDLVEERPATVSFAAPADPAAAELRLVLDEELERLPEKYRRPVVLCYLEGQTQEEAARALGWTKGTVSGRLARAKDLLRQRLSRRGLAPTASVLGACLAPEAASAAVPAALLQPTVRAAGAASLAGMEAALGSGGAAALARGVIRAMSLGRFKSAVPALVVALGAAAVAGPRLIDPGPLALPANATPRGLTTMGPSGERMRLGTTDRRHTAPVCDVAYAAGGETVLTAQVDGLVRLWSPDVGSPVRTFDLFGEVQTPDKALRAAALAPGGNRLAGVGFVFDPAARRMVHGVWLWDVANDAPLRTIEVETLDLFCVAFSPEGASLATGDYEGKVRLMDVATGEELAKLDLGKGRVTSLAFAPDGMTLAAALLGEGVRLWDLGGGKDLGRLGGNAAGQASCPQFSPNGQLVAAATPDGVAIWDRAELGHRRRVDDEGQGRGVLSLAFAPDGRSLAAIGADDTLRLLDAETGRRKWVTPVGRGRGNPRVAFSPDGRTVVTACGGALRYLDTATGLDRYPTPGAHSGAVTSVRYGPDGRTLVSASDDGTIRAWDLESGRQLRSFEPGGRVGPIAIAPGGLFLAAAVGTDRPSIVLWDLQSDEPTGSFPPADAGRAIALAFSADGTRLHHLGEGGSLGTIEVDSGREPAGGARRLDLSTLVEAGHPARGLFSPDAGLLAVGSAGKIRVFDPRTGAERYSFPGDAVAFSHDGRTLASATPGRAAEIELADRSKSIDEWRTEGIDLLDAMSGRRKLRIPRSRDRVIALAFSPDDRRIAVAESWPATAIKIYRTEDGHEVGAFTPPAAAGADALSFSPDGRSLAAGLEDTTVLIWDVSEVR
jgi:RNA polymerase sigma factor (sigma-70 family)